MDQQLLLVILGSAVTALAVTAGLGWLMRKTPAAGGWVVGALAMAAAFVPAARIVQGGWPPWPPVQALDWMLVLAATALLGVALATLVPARRAWVRGAGVGLAAAAVLIAFPLSRGLARIDAIGVRLGWMVGLAVLLAATGAVTAAAMQRAAETGDPQAGVLSRLRDRHWPTVALGLVLGLGAPAMLFSTHVKKLLDLGVGLACGMAGAAIAAWLVTRRVNLAGAGVVAVVLYTALWSVGWFYSGSDPSPLAVALGVAAPLPLVIGTWGPLARRGGWVRMAVVVVAAAGLAAAAVGVGAPAYLQELREMQMYGG